RGSQDPHVATRSDGQSTGADPIGAGAVPTTSQRCSLDRKVAVTHIPRGAKHMARARTTFGAFNQGAVHTIACFNKATMDLGVNLDELIVAMQVYVNNFVVPVWSTPANLIKSTDFVPGNWAMVFLDDADQPGALAYHDLTPDGLPVSKVFV